MNFYPSYPLGRQNSQVGKIFYNTSSYIRTYVSVERDEISHDDRLWSLAGLSRFWWTLVQFFFPSYRVKYLKADIWHIYCQCMKKFGRVRGLANRHLFTPCFYAKKFKVCAHKTLTFAGFCAIKLIGNDWMTEFYLVFMQLILIRPIISKTR